MAKITLKKGLASVAVGLANIGTKELDKSKGWTEPFKNSNDIFRTAALAISGFVNFLGIEEDFSEAAFYSAVPLFAETAYEAVRKYFKLSSSSERKVITTSEAGFKRIAQVQVPATPVARPAAPVALTSY